MITVRKVKKLTFGDLIERTAKSERDLIIRKILKKVDKNMIG